MFDFKQFFFSYNFEINYFVLKFHHVWCHQKMTLIFKEYSLEKTSLLGHHIMRKEKKGEKGKTPMFFPIQENNSLKKKKTHYPSQYHLIKLLHFSSSLKPPHLKKSPVRDEF